MAQVGTAPRFVNLLDLPNKEAFLNSFDIIISDLEGILCNQTVPMQGSLQAMIRLRKAGKSFKLLTDDSRRNDEQFTDYLRDLGLTDVKYADIIHPSKAIVRFLQSYKEGKSIFSLCPPEINDFLAKNTIVVNFLDPATTLTASSLQETLGVDQKVGSVIMDTNFNITYGQLAKAQQYLLDPACVLVVSTTNDEVVVGQNLTTLGNAGFVQLLRDYATGNISMLCKPNSALMEHVMAQFKITNPGRVLFVGTHLINDIQFALNAGFQTLLITSGASDLELMDRLAMEAQPHFVLNDFADFSKLFKRRSSSGTRGSSGRGARVS